MAIPDFQSIMLPLLRLLDEKKELEARDAEPFLGDRFRLTEDERKELLPSGKQEIFLNRVGWARTYLKKAGLLETPRRGLWKLTERGKSVLSKNPEKINISFLKQFPEFISWGLVKKDKSVEVPDLSDVREYTPEETLESAIEELRTDLQSELIQQVKSSSPSFFEKLVVDLLVKMGYGGNRKDAGQAIGRSGDGGIDGIIKEDPLGLDTVFIQAKQWESNVGRPEIQKFAGALQGQRARKGIFITTADFTSDAKTYTSAIDSKIVLINGKDLVRLMIQHDLGVNIVDTYHVKKIDTDYFSEE